MHDQKVAKSRLNIVINGFGMQLVVKELLAWTFVIVRVIIVGESKW
jgi:hypothetical protein